MDSIPPRLERCMSSTVCGICSNGIESFHEAVALAISGTKSTPRVNISSSNGSRVRTF